MADDTPASRDNWDAHWTHYAESAAENPAVRMRHQIIARFLGADSDKSAMQVLDLGSGQGDLIAQLQPLLPDAVFVGAELSETGVAISRRKVPGATFFVADLFQPPTALSQ